MYPVLDPTTPPPTLNPLPILCLVVKVLARAGDNVKTASRMLMESYGPLADPEPLILLVEAEILYRRSKALLVEMGDCS